MWNVFWPIGLVVLANCVYNICAKSTPTQANAFVSLFVTYLVAAAATLVLFWFQRPGTGLLSELKKLNGTTVALGLAVVALEFGYINVYRVGWKITVASLVANIILACALVVIGVLLYHEAITLRQVAGIAVCAVGLVLLGK